LFATKVEAGRLPLSLNLESPSALDLLYHCALNLHQLDMCGMAIEHTVLKHFLEPNKKSIRSISCHGVNIRVYWLEDKVS
jgi:hypothetical protein